MTRPNTPRKRRIAAGWERLSILRAGRGGGGQRIGGLVVVNHRHRRLSKFFLRVLLMKDLRLSRHLLRRAVLDDGRLDDRGPGSRGSRRRLL